MNNPGTTEIVVSDVIELSRLAESRFAMLVFERGLAHVARMSWTTDAGSLDPVLPYAISTSRGERRRRAVLDLERVVGEACVAIVSLSSESFFAQIAASEQPALREAETWLRGCFGAREREAGEPRVRVTFWSYGGYANDVARSIVVPVWEEIAENYPSRARTVLERLCNGGYRPSASGQLLLWHGDPGTGKTYALRALGWAWREWCDLHYVTDPETFFGTNADYMMDVLLDDEDEGSERWRLLVLEDTQDLLAAGGAGGAGLSRLLNVVDGIVGQGLRILVLVTTNEPIRRLHPAVRRPGRCAARVEFGPFEPGEARAWLERHGGGTEVPARPTLARLFAQARGEEEGVEEAESRPFGFA